MTILIVGDAEDLTSAYVAFKAQERGLPVQVLDESRFGLDWRLQLDDTAEGTDRLELADGSELPLRWVAGAFVRFTPTPDVPNALRDSPPASETYARERRAALHVLLHRLAAPVANPPGRGQANGSKPLQMAQLAGAAFDVPRWVASNDVDHIRAFVAGLREGAVVKSCSGTRSEVRRCSEPLLERVAGGSCPVIVQQWVEGFDVRLHTVGTLAFATAIDAGPGIDYRFDDTRRQYRACPAPAPVVERCVEFATAQGLLLAGFDFRVDSSNRWWCLECNPAPTFLPYEMETGQAIADALLNLMMATAHSCD
jgi:hypothetical protein